MIMTGNYTDANWNKLNETMQEDLKTSEASSVYAGVDRSTFQPAGIALTSEARQIQSTTGTSYANKLFGIDTTYIKIAGYATSLALVSAGIGSLVHSGTVKEAAIAKQQADAIKRAADDAAAATKALQDTVAEKYQATADKFCFYLQNTLNYDYVDTVELGTNYGYRRIFEKFKGNDKVTVKSYDQKGNTTVDCKKVLEEVGKNEEYQTALQEYNDAVEAAKVKPQATR